MIRNDHLNELEMIGYLIALPCGFIPALIFHFASRFTGRHLKWAIAAGWGVTGVFTVLGFAGLDWHVEGVHTYDWGNVFRVVPSALDPWGMAMWFVLGLASCWLFYRGARKATSMLERRHHLYILAGLLVITFAIVKVGVVNGVNAPILLPLGMFLVDVLNAIIGVAIIKDRLLDITVIVKKGALYSALVALLILIYGLLEHTLITLVGETVGEGSSLLRFLSIAVGIAVLIPVKSRLERLVERYFAARRLQFWATAVGTCRPQ